MYPIEVVIRSETSIMLQPYNAAQDMQDHIALCDCTGNRCPPKPSQVSRPNGLLSWQPATLTHNVDLEATAGKPGIRICLPRRHVDGPCNCSR